MVSTLISTVCGACQQSEARSAVRCELFVEPPVDWPNAVGAELKARWRATVAGTLDNIIALPPAALGRLKPLALKSWLRFALL